MWKLFIAVLVAASTILPAAAKGPGVAPQREESITYPTPAKPYKRVMMFTGGGLQTALFLGMLEGAEQAGKSPELIIGTCGGAISAALAQSIPSSLGRKLFIESREYHEAMLAAKIDNGSLIRAIGNIGKMIARRTKLKNSQPNLFSNTVMTAPEMLSEALTVGFSTDDISYRALISAGKSFFTPENVGQSRGRGNKFFQEVYFTDRITAQYLQDFPSGAGMDHPASYVMASTEVKTNISVGTAARAGITDPYYINPIIIDGYYHFTGAMNLYPMELANHLGEEIIAPYMSGFDLIVEDNAFSSAYGYSSNDRLRKFHSDKNINFWVDFSDAVDTIYKTSGFNPKPNLTKLRIESGVPEDFVEYKRMSNELWEFGRQRALEAFARPERDQSHIRSRNCLDSYPGQPGCPIQKAKSQRNSY